MTTLEKHTAKLATIAFSTVAMADQAKFMTGKAGKISAALKQMIDGVENYCEAIKTETDWIVGNDYVLAPEVAAIINSLIGLLNGPGRFDGGTLDGALREIAKTYELADVEQ